MKERNIYSTERAQYLFLVLIIFFLQGTLKAQVFTKVVRDIQKVRNSISSYVPNQNEMHQRDIPAPNISIVLKEDSIDALAGLPYRFGKDIDVDIDIVKEGSLITQGDTSYVFYQIKSKNSKSINLIFDKFKLTIDAELKIFNIEQNTIFGPITSKGNPSNGIFWTDVIQGEGVFIQLKAPKKNIKNIDLHISKVVYGYKNTFSGYGQSASCNIDVACSQGDNWHKDASAVALLLLDNGTRFCTGTILNNTSLNFTPYFLTAFHCLDLNEDGVLSTSEMNAVGNWLFRFLYESPSCNGGDDINYVTLNGASFRSAFQPSDFALIELNNRPDPEDTIYYAGWSRDNLPATSAVGIHHPNGDVKKIAIENNSLTNINITTPWNRDSYGNVTVSCPPNTHWAATFEEGTVQPGSSGSPIFDQNHRIVGQLHGDYLNTNSDYCANRRGQYGKFDVSWTGGGTNTTRLSPYVCKMQRYYA